MKVLLDQNVPAGLRRLLDGHQVTTTKQLGWETIKNGDLVMRAEEQGYQVLVTCDQSLRYQQNLEGRELAIVVLGTNRWSDIRRSTDAVTAAVGRATPGSYCELEIEHQVRPLGRA